MVQKLKTLILFLLSAVAISSLCGEANGNGGTSGDDPEVQRHIQRLINQLPPDSFLRRQLLAGARGDGVHQAWMDDLRRQGIKRAVAWVEITFKRNGEPKRTRIYRTELFAKYEGCERVLDAGPLDILRTTGVLEKIGSAALEKAAHGNWVDVPKPKPHPFVGAARIVFFDDEWLPVLRAPLYCAGKECLEFKCTGTDIEKGL